MPRMKTEKRIGIGLLLLAAIVLFSSCSGSTDGQVACRCLTLGTGEMRKLSAGLQQQGKESLPCEEGEAWLIESREEIEQIIASMTAVSDYYFREFLWTEYDAAFFRNNSLIVVSGLKTLYPVTLKTPLLIQDGCLKLTFLWRNGLVSDRMDTPDNPFLIEVKKADIAGMNRIAWESEFRQ